MSIQAFQYLPSKQSETKIISDQIYEYNQNFYFLTSFNFHNHRHLNFRVRNERRDHPKPFLMKKMETCQRSQISSNNTGPCKCLLCTSFYYTFLHTQRKIKHRKEISHFSYQSVISGKKTQNKSVSQILMVSIDVTNSPKLYYFLKVDMSFLQQLGFSFI